MPSSSPEAREFVLAGHSNKWALGTPRGHSGPPALVQRECFGRIGHFAVEETPLPRSAAYWNLFVEAARDRDAVLSYEGSQHVIGFLFLPKRGFDFIEPTVPGPLAAQAAIVPRRMVEARFAPSMGGLRNLLKRLQEGGARRCLVVGTPPPSDDLGRFEKEVRSSAFWARTFAQQNFNIDNAQFVTARLLLKLWAVLQDVTEAATREAGGTFIRVPDSLRDANGFLAPEHRLRQDFTHAADSFGQEMLRHTLTA